MRMQEVGDQTIDELREELVAERESASYVHNFKKEQDSPPPEEQAIDITHLHYSQDTTPQESVPSRDGNHAPTAGVPVEIWDNQDLYHQCQNNVLSRLPLVYQR